MKNIIVTLSLLFTLDNLGFSQSKALADSLIGHIPMVKVIGGSFMMGTPDYDPDEKPAHQVTLKTYYLAKYEVTQKLWATVMRYNSSRFGQCAQCPVERVSWKEVQEFIAKLNKITGKKYRLPTEAEWEYAARGGQKGKNTTYSGGEDVLEVAWSYDNAKGKTHPVGQKNPNRLGIYDMSGNVYEWCQDWYKNNYYQQKISYNNPQGPTEGTEKVLRGGSWDVYDIKCRVTNRGSAKPSTRFDFLGFRLALSVVE